MTDKELRKLRRDDLLQILINQQRQLDELSAALEKSEQALARREIAVKESGSLAEAALRLNNVFESAQAAAEQYEQELKARADEMIAAAERQAIEAKRVADETLGSARTEAERILREARIEAERLRANAGTPVEFKGSRMPEDASGEEKRHGLLWRNKKA